MKSWEPYQEIMKCKEHKLDWPEGMIWWIEANREEDARLGWFINYLYEAVVSLTKPRLVAAVEWSKTKAAVSLSSNCTAATENRREGTNMQSTNRRWILGEREREERSRGWMASLTKRRRRDSVNERRKVEDTAGLSWEFVCRRSVQDKRLSHIVWAGNQ